ncbi:MAG: magnesium transporter, partial [Rhizomicrobium sp.]
MLKIYQQQNGGLRSSEIAPEAPIPAASLWIDLLNPTLDERRAVDKFLNMELPTRADMEEI